VIVSRACVLKNRQLWGDQIGPADVSLWGGPRRSQTVSPWRWAGRTSRSGHQESFVGQTYWAG